MVFYSALLVLLGVVLLLEYLWFGTGDTKKATDRNRGLEEHYSTIEECIPDDSSIEGKSPAKNQCTMTYNCMMKTLSDQFKVFLTLP